jgi:hypothetical protein
MQTSENDHSRHVHSPKPETIAAHYASGYEADGLRQGASQLDRKGSRFVNRGPEFDGLYIHRPVLAACCQVIGRPFKLSTMLARTVEPGTPAQRLHVDVKRGTDGWPLVGFIVMVDAFHAENGATRFVPGSHRWPREPDVEQHLSDTHGREVLACGPAGSVIIFNGSVWHGHRANRSKRSRRSIQGAFIPREARAAMDQAARIRPETFGRLSDLAKYILEVKPSGKPNPAREQGHAGTELLSQPEVCLSAWRSVQQLASKQFGHGRLGNVLFLGPIPKGGSLPAKLLVSDHCRVIPLGLAPDSSRTPSLRNRG